MIIGIIPARGGSKGIPRKNIKSVFGQPLIYWSIQAAKKSKLIDKFYVSTEDPEIASISSELGALVLKRPDNLSQDDSTTMSVLQHHFQEDLEDTDAIVLLQCTSPYRDEKLIDDCIKKYKDGDYDSLATGFNCNYEPWGDSNRPRQEIGGFFYDDGNVYILSSDLLKKDNPTTCGDRPYQYYTHRYHNHEIDDDFDLMVSEKIFEFKKV
mgnify:FL=1